MLPVGRQNALNTVQWENIALNSRYPAMSFTLDLSFSEVKAECDAGSLISFDYYDEEMQGHSRGTSLSVSSGSKLYWAPPHNADSPSAKVRFAVLGTDGTVLYKGIFTITGTETTENSTLYSAVLKNCSGLSVSQDDDLGGILTPISD